MPGNESLFTYLDRRRRERGPLPPVRSVLVRGREAALQADTAVRSAANVLTFGGADKAAALIDAALGGGPIGLPERYAAELAGEEARNRYDAIHRPTAQRVGEGAAVAASFVRGGPLIPVLKAPRLAGAAGITAREAASALGVGGIIGASGQAVGDAVTRQASSPGDYAGAALGGAAGVAALPFGASRAAGVEGAVTSATQDLLNGRMPSLQSMGQSSLAGRAFGGTADKAAAAFADVLSSRTKGQLGETMGAIRSVADWRPREAGKPALRPVYEGSPNGPRWKADGVHRASGTEGADLWLEDKFGPYARLSKNQRKAAAELLSSFQLNHFLPMDVGLAASRPAATAGVQGRERLERRRQAP